MYDGRHSPMIDLYIKHSGLWLTGGRVAGLQNDMARGYHFW